MKENPYNSEWYQTRLDDSIKESYTALGNHKINGDTIHSFIEKQLLEFGNIHAGYRHVVVRKLDPFIELLDFCVAIHGTLINRIGHILKNDSKALWAEAEAQPACNLTFILLLRDMSQSLFCLRQVIHAGFERQATTLFRSYFEYSCIVIAYIIDENFRKNFVLPTKTTEEK